ncbi:MAG: hypothetical protein IIX42_02435, partial [Alistipes sp.]|nr:hypothetical protein [Alistipes sp.]
MKKLHLLILTLCSALLFTTACVGGGDLVDNKPVNKEEQEKPDPEPENPDNTDDPNDPGETPPADEVFPFISSDPKFITADMTTDVIVYLNTEGTTMDNFKGDIYAHTGVLTSASTSTGDWKYVKTDWGVNDNSCKLSKVKTNIYKLIIKGGPRAFYGVPASEKITHLAFVFRSADSTTELKDNGNDIFIELSEAGLGVKILAPADRAILDLNVDYTVSVTAQAATSVTIYKNSQVVATS